MRKKQTPGERIGFAIQHMLENTKHQDSIAKRIDRAIRRAQAQAWDEGQLAGWADTHDPNPYRKSKR